jgi:hypothetical protein
MISEPDMKRKDAMTPGCKGFFAFEPCVSAPLRCYPSEPSRAEDFGLRWQSAAATPLFDCGQSFQSGVALRFPPQSKKIWLRLYHVVFFCG